MSTFILSWEEVRNTKCVVVDQLIININMNINVETEIEMNEKTVDMEKIKI